jgi:iron-sulfur cluster repair protein YtfE (RIC family)
VPPVISEASFQHHEALVPQIDALVPLASALETEPLASLKPKLDEACSFLTGQLIPHMEMAEQRLFPALEGLLSDPRATEPLRREHASVRSLVRDLGQAVEHLHQPIAPGEAMALRRILIRLFAILKVHVAEEEHYLPILDHNLPPDEARRIAGAMEHATVHPL